MRYQVGRFGNLWYVIDTKTSKFVYGPYKQRMTAMGKLQGLNKKLRLRANRTKKMSRNPKGTVIYGRLLRIEAQKTQPHACDADCASRDHKYYHDFKKGSHAQVIGLPDKSLHIVSKERK